MDGRAESAFGAGERVQPFFARLDPISSITTGVEVWEDLLVQITSVAFTKIVMVLPQRGQRHTCGLDLPDDMGTRI